MGRLWEVSHPDSVLLEARVCPNWLFHGVHFKSNSAKILDLVSDYYVKQKLYFGEKLL